MLDALADIGSQPTIISRGLLQKIGTLLIAAGKPLPTLELPMARLFGKDGAGGGWELIITAQTNLVFEADGESACISA
jgi:hypothetical protein